MRKIPNQPQDIFVPLTEDYLAVFNKDLISLILYGSAAAGLYVRGKSDINILAVLTPAGINRLEDAFEVVKNWKKRNVATPLVVTKEFILSSLDAYPIEFLNMKNNSVLIYGENVLAELVFRPEDLRLQIEREITSKILLLREGYLESAGAARRIRELISKSLTAFIAIFNAMLYLKQKQAPRDRLETLAEMSRVFALDADVFRLCLAVRQKTDKLSGREVIETFKKYLREAEKAGSIIDRFKQ